MPKKNESSDYGQLSIFDFLELAGNIAGNYSSKEIEAAIDKLREAKHFAEKCEENERRRKAKEEAERKTREEKERKEAHVREVTCMDLPLDWGFDIVLPANMTLEKPYIWLSGQGKYYVELGDTDIGNLVRIDNYLDTLSDHLEKLKTGLSKLMEKEVELKAELSKDESYCDKIEKYKAEVEKIDKKLGVDKK